MCDVVGNASKESFYGVMLAKCVGGVTVPYINILCSLCSLSFLVLFSEIEM